MNTIFRLLALVLLATVLPACRLTGGDGTPTPATTLEGTEWRLVTLNGQVPLTGTTITGKFSQGQIGGSSGCNSYFGSYTLRGSDLQVQGLGGTEMACLEPAGIMDQEQTFLRTLGAVANYQLADDKVRLQDTEGKTVLIFVRIEPEPDAALEGTTWELTTFVDGDVASSLISGTAITLSLERGTARGSAGCNDYGGAYTLRPGVLEIPEVDISEQLCPEPVGIMEQEAQYVAILKSVTTFELDGSQLVLRTDGATGLVFVAQASPSYGPTPETTATAPSAAGYPVITAENVFSLSSLSTRLPGSFLAWTPDSECIAIDTGGVLELVDVQSGQPAGVPIGIGEPVAHALFSPDGNVLALFPAESNTPVVMWDTVANEPLEAWNRRIAGATSVAFSPDGQMLAAGYPDGSIRLWNAASGENTHNFSTLEVLTVGGPASDVRFSPDGRTLAAFAASAEGAPTVLLWDISGGEALDSYDPIGLIAGPVAYPYLPPGWQYIVWISRGSVILVDPTDDQEVGRFEHEDSVLALSFSPDASLLATAAYETADTAFSPVVTIWDVPTGAELTTLIGFGASPTALAFSPDGTLLVVSVEGQSHIFSAAP